MASCARSMRGGMADILSAMMASIRSRVGSGRHSGCCPWPLVKAGKRRHFIPAPEIEREKLTTKMHPFLTFFFAELSKSRYSVYYIVLPKKEIAIHSVYQYLLSHLPIAPGWQLLRFQEPPGCPRSVTAPCLPPHQSARQCLSGRRKSSLFL